MNALTGGGTLDRNSTALIIIDMQNDFLDSAGYFAHRGLPVQNLRASIEPVRQLRAALQPEVNVMFTQQVYETDGSDDLARVHRIRPSGLSRSGVETPVVRGGWGAGIIPELQPHADDLVVVKRRFDAFYQTDLELLLRCKGVKTLVFAGVVADVCVETTLRSAYVRDFDVILARECVAAWNNASLARTISAVEQYFGVALTNSQILNALKYG